MSLLQIYHICDVVLINLISNLLFYLFVYEQTRSP